MARIAKIEVKRCIIAYMKDLILQTRLLFSADSHLLKSTTYELREPRFGVSRQSHHELKA
jgi:hypothetical protein